MLQGHATRLEERCAAIEVRAEFGGGVSRSLKACKQAFTSCCISATSKS